MAFRLIVTRPNGTQTHSTADPLQNREATGMSALRVLADKGIKFGAEGIGFGRRVRDAAVGETVTHEPSGYTFRTEDFSTALPSRFNATPAEIDAHLRSILAEDTYLKFQQAIGEHAIAQTVEDTDVVRAGADNEGLYNNDWREGWDDYRDRVDPDQNGPYPVKLIDFPKEAP